MTDTKESDVQHSVNRRSPAAGVVEAFCLACDWTFQGYVALIEIVDRNAWEHLNRFAHSNNKEMHTMSEKTPENTPANTGNQVQGNTTGKPSEEAPKQGETSRTETHTDGNHHVGDSKPAGLSKGDLVTEKEAGLGFGESRTGIVLDKNDDGLVVGFFGSTAVVDADTLDKR